MLYGIATAIPLKNKLLYKATAFPVQIYAVALTLTPDACLFQTAVDACACPGSYICHTATCRTVAFLFPECCLQARQTSVFSMSVC